ncbi:MAG TPA: GDSL-type esterase/lipase family protein [Thermodesulfobacteriota bacterium]|nr:GDSL-type esterase/lipase family protein [Thermodesulfobacteriota bacterium]
MKQKLSLVITNIVVVLILLIVIEAVGQVAYYFRYGMFLYQMLPGADYPDVFELHPYLVGRLKKNVSATDARTKERISATKYHTRSTGSQENDSGLVRVAVLGGSTTFGTGVTDADSWPAILQRKLGKGYCVINYGMPGYTTAEAIIQTALIVPERKPQFVIFYEGWNDIHNYHVPDLGEDYYADGMSQYEILEIPIKRESKLWGELYQISAIGRLAAKIKRVLTGPDVQPCPEYDTPDEFVDKIYVRNLETLKLLSEHIAPYTLFVPQILNYQAFKEKQNLDACSSSWSTHIKNSAMPRLMDRLNLLMKTVCAENDPKCLYEGAVLKVKWQTDDFIDDGHFSKKGGEKFADVIAATLLAKTREMNQYSHNHLQ